MEENIPEQPESTDSDPPRKPISALTAFARGLAFFIYTVLAALTLFGGFAGVVSYNSHWSGIIVLAFIILDLAGLFYAVRGTLRTAAIGRIVALAAIAICVWAMSVSFCGTLTQMANR